MNNMDKTSERDSVKEQLTKEQLPSNAVLQFDNDGNIVLRNRQYRRRKLTLVEGNASTTRRRTKNKIRNDRKTERANKKKGRR